MAKLTSMKMSKKESKEQDGSVGIEAPQFPHGLSLRLNDESMAKLSLGKLPEVGSEIALTAIVKVESVEESEQMDGGKSRSMSLQITSMGLDVGSTDEEKAKKLFGGDK